MNRTEMLQLMKQLDETFMPSGFETPQAAWIREFAESMGYRTVRDVLGNLFCFRDKDESRKEPTGKWMFAAAMDVPGFLAAHTSEEGICFQTIGAFPEPEKLEDVPVKFESGVCGKIIWKTEEKKKLRIEIEHPESVHTGDAAVIKGEGREREDGTVCVTHGFQLAGCLTLLEAMYLVKEDTAADEIVFVFLAQHQPGRMGLRAAVKRVAPQTCILCGGAEAEGSADVKYPVDVKIGEGPVIRFREALQANDEGTCRLLIDAAEKSRIRWQGEARNRVKSGGVEAMAAGRRPGVGGLCVPVQKLSLTETVFRPEEVRQCGRVLAACASEGLSCAGKNEIE